MSRLYPAEDTWITTSHPVYPLHLDYQVAVFDNEATQQKRRAEGWREHEVRDNGIIVWSRPRPNENERNL